MTGQTGARNGFTREQTVTVALMLAFSMMSYFDRTIMSIAGPQIMKEFDISETQMGSVYSAFILSYAVMMIPAGHVADRLGARLTLLLMGLSAALFTALTAFGGKPGLGSILGVVPALIAIRLGFGVATAPLYPACGKMSGHWIPAADQGRVQALIIAGSSIGAAVSPILFSWLMSVFLWRVSFGLAAVATATLALFWFWSVRDHPAGFLPTGRGRTKEPRARTEWLALLTNRNLVLVTLAYFTLGYFDYIFFYWIYYYLGQVRHVGFSQSARYTTIIFVTMGIMMPIGGWISDRLTRSSGARFGRRVVPMVGLSLGSILLYAGTVAPGITTAVLSFSLAIGFASWCEGPFWASTIEAAGEQAGTACGILNTGANVGGFIAPVLTPFIASRAGWSWGLYVGVLIAIMGVVACYLVDPRTDEIAAGKAATNGPGIDFNVS
jgi:ACS family glucarate transporter-like MFS transporter